MLLIEATFLITVGVFIFVVDFSIKASFFYHLPFLSKSGELFDFACPLFEIRQLFEVEVRLLMVELLNIGKTF